MIALMLFPTWTRKLYSSLTTKGRFMFGSPAYVPFICTKSLFRAGRDVNSLASTQCSKASFRLKYPVTLFGRLLYWSQAPM